MKFGATRWDDMTPPPAEVRPAVTETEDEKDIRFFKEYQKQGKVAFKNAAERAESIFQRGNWKSSGLSWGKWAVQNLEISRCYAYSLVATRNDAMKELIEYYKAEPPNQPVSSRFLKNGAPDDVHPQEDEKPLVLSTTKLLDTPKPEFHVEQFKPAPDMGKWATKVLAYIDDMPKSQIYGKLSRESIKVFQEGLESFRLLLAELLPQEPVKEFCKCGCGLSAAVSAELFKHGIPCMGLTTGQAGMIMGRLKANDWRLPEAFAFLKNEGELFVRRFKGKPAKK